MSFARFADDSSVYIYESAESLNYVCSNCTLTEQTVSGFYSDIEFEKISDMLEHLQDHESEGDLVPTRCVERLQEVQKAKGNDNRALKRSRRRRGVDV